jgi:type III secretion system FlhB-like substrate exporter
VHGLVNLPAVLILCLISLLLMRGVRESTRVNSVIEEHHAGRPHDAAPAVLAEGAGVVGDERHVVLRLEITLADGSSVHGLVNLPAVLILCLISLLLMRGVRDAAPAVLAEGAGVVGDERHVVLRLDVEQADADHGAQEVKNPQRTMMVGILGSLAVCTVLYIAFAAVLTTASEPRMPTIMVRCGFFTSCAAVETASKPI